MPLTLRLPLEVIERVLYFALGADQRPAKPSNAWDKLGPPQGTAHLLLVSKGITALALPSYWRIITIFTYYDWIMLWDPETGLLAGENGRERASWVEEVRINVADVARLPLEPDMSHNPYDTNSHGHDLPQGALVELEAVPLPRLKHVCFFDFVLVPFSLDEDDEDGNLFCSDDRWSEAARRQWEASQYSRQDMWYDDLVHSSEYDEDTDDNEEIANWLDDDEDTFDLEQAAREEDLEERRRLIITDLLGLDDARLETIRMPLDHEALSLMRHTPAREGFPRIAIYCSTDDDESDGKALRKANLDRNLAYDFLKVQTAVQPSLAADLKRRYGNEAVKTWRWGNKDRTTRSLIE